MAEKCSRCNSRPARDGLRTCDACGHWRARKRAADFEIIVEEPTVSPPECNPGRDYTRLVAEARRRGATLGSVGAAMGIDPVAVATLIADARAAGWAIDMAGEMVGIRAAPPVDEQVDVAPISGDMQVVAAAGDFHFGSKYCMRAEIRDFVAIAYLRGAREVLVPGDILDGCYRHGRFELSHHGISDQADDAVATLPALPGLAYHCICGNHEQTFTENVGVEVGRFIEDRFRAAGRSDIKFHGNSGAYLRIRGMVVDLWHPKGSAPYALTYVLQKRIESYSPGLKPDILLCGHLHKSARCTVRGVHGYLVPCFQSGGSAFGNSLVGAPVNGGLILSWRTTEHGTLRSVTSEEISYYHNERAREVRSA